MQGPHLVQMSSQKMAVVRTEGDPNVVGPKVMKPLYGSVYTLKSILKKKGIDFRVGALRARWPNAPNAPKDKWLGIWGLPVPNDTTSLPQKIPEVEVRLEVWDYGLVAEVLHKGPYSTEQNSILRLLDFIKDNGCEVVGSHEEEYLTKPTASVVKTIIRLPVRKLSDK